MLFKGISSNSSSPNAAISRMLQNARLKNFNASMCSMSFELKVDSKKQICAGNPKKMFQIC